MVWCLWPLQPQWDVLHSWTEPREAQWHQVALLQRPQLLLALHHHDDSAFGLLKEFRSGSREEPGWQRPQQQHWHSLKGKGEGLLKAACRDDAKSLRCLSITCTHFPTATPHFDYCGELGLEEGGWNYFPKNWIWLFCANLVLASGCLFFFLFFKFSNRIRIWRTGTYRPWSIE